MKTFLRFILIIFLILAVVAISRNVFSQIDKLKEIREAEIKSQEVSKKNQELKSKLEKEKGDIFLEREARNKLGYQKEGETLYVVDVSDKEVTRSQEEERNKNWQEWLNTLFH